MSDLVVELSPSRCPSISEVASIIRGATVRVGEDAYKALDSSRAAYLAAVEGGERVYGYCTGLGGLLDRSARGCEGDWERHVLVEHAMGVGENAPETFVRAFLAVRLVQIARGRAPVRRVVAERIAEALNKGFIPVIHVHGSVGASGDLAPSAEAFLCLFYGEGRAFSGGRMVTCSEAMKELGLGVLPLEPGEALALINNTAWSTALGVLGYLSLSRLWEEAVEAAKKTLVAAGCKGEHYSVEVLESTLHEGVRLVGKRLSGLEKLCGERRLQDPYSLRCTPQVLGAAYEAIQFAGRLLEEELCSSTENPIVVAGRVRHWCGFHSVHAALAVDALKLAASYIANLSERRISQLLRGEITGLQDFLASPGDSVGAMIAQYTAAALSASIRLLSAPQSVHTIPTSGLQEDIVPMTPEAGLQLLEAVERLALIIAVETAVAEYAGKRMAGGVEELRRLIDSHSVKLLGEIYSLHGYTGARGPPV